MMTSLSAVGYRRVRAASVAAAGWALAAIAILWLTLADLLAAPPTRAPALSAVWTFVVSVPQGTAAAVTAAAAVVSAMLCRLTLTPSGRASH